MNRSEGMFHGISRRTVKSVALTCLLVLAVPIARANEEDLDAYKFRVAGFWWFSQPSGQFHGKGDTSTIDMRRDLGFGDYSTFTGTADWRFKRKHHLTFWVSPVESTNSKVLLRTVTFRGQTFEVGTRASADIQSFSFAPGYQWDFIRRNWGYVALATQLNLLDTKASISRQVVVDGQTRRRTASGSVFAPLPIFGPRARWYPVPSSNRLALEGSVQGMYFFGYGDFYSARGTAGIGLTHNFRITAGYQVGTRLSIHGKSQDLGIRLTQKGPVAGIEASW